MFGIDFSEFLVIGVVALIVLGPERLPKVARTVGHLLGRFQRYASEVKDQVKREMEAEDLKKLEAQFHEARDAVQNAGNTIHQEMTQAETEAKQSLDTAHSSLEFVEPAPAAPPVKTEDEPAQQAQVSVPQADVPSPQLELPLHTPPTGDKAK